MLLYYPFKGWRMLLFYCTVDILGRFKCLATGLDAFLACSSASRRCSRNRSPSRLLVSPMQRVPSYAVNGIGWGTGDEMISDLDGSLGSRYFPNVANERTCFASCARAFKSHLVRCVTFVVLTTDQLVGRDDGPPVQQKQDSHLRRRKCTFPLILWKSQNPNYKEDEV